jgi:hypothetical protein
MEKSRTAENRTQAAQPVSRRYTDWAIPISVFSRFKAHIFAQRPAIKTAARDFPQNFQENTERVPQIKTMATDFNILSNSLFTGPIVWSHVV